MSIKPKAMGAGEFKARCLALLDEVERTHRPVVVTKRGRPIAQLVPIDDAERAPLEGLIVSQGDLVTPLDEGWDAER